MTPDRTGRPITSRGEWLRWRRGCMTASRIAALFDAHPYLSRDQLAAELRGESMGDTPAMRAGRILEPGVAVAIAEEHPEWQVTKAATFHAVADIRFGCTPDFWLGDDGLIQAGTQSPEEWEAGHGKAPFYKILQTVAEMLVTGREHGKLAIMVRSRSLPLHIFDVPRHEHAEARILDAVAEWWRAWDAGKIAPPASAAGLEEAFDDGSHIDLSADNEMPGLLDFRERLKENATNIRADIDRIECAIKAKIGSARTAWLPGWRLSWPTIERAEYTVPAGHYRRLDIRREPE